MQHYVLTDQDDCSAMAGTETESLWRPKARNLQSRRQRFFVRSFRYRKRHVRSSD